MRLGGLAPPARRWKPPAVLLQSSGISRGSARANGRGGAGVESQGDGTISSKVFVGNLSFDVTREELVEAFGAVGRVVDAKVPTDRETGRPRGFAFVEFENDEAVQKCIEQMNGRDLKGRAMRVNAAEDRPPRPAGAPAAASRVPAAAAAASRAPVAPAAATRAQVVAVAATLGPAEASGRARRPPSHRPRKPAPTAGGASSRSPSRSPCARPAPGVGATTSSRTTTPITRRPGGPTPRTTVRRLPERGRYDRETIHAILDEAFVCHVGFVDQGQPFVIPTAFARIGDEVVIHGSAASRMLKLFGAGASGCLTVTLVDGLVLARSAFHHSMNYRSVVVLGTPREIMRPGREDAGARRDRGAHRARAARRVRGASEVELRATRVVAFALDEASAKLRTGAPKDDEEDYALPVWAGELPLTLQALEPVADPRLTPGIPLPAHVSTWRRGVRRF